MNAGLMVEAAGGLGIVWAGVSLLFAHTSKSWPSTRGRIVASVLDVGHDSRGNRIETAEIAYMYSVDGREFVRSRMNRGAGAHLGRVDSWSLERERDGEIAPAGRRGRRLLLAAASGCRVPTARKIFRRCILAHTFGIGNGCFGIR